MPLTAGSKIKAVIETIIYQLETNKRMKLNTLLNKSSRLLFYCLLTCVLFSCSEKYPKYSLEAIGYVPDSLKKEYRTWVTETVRAASQHMTGGDYEDVDETIFATERVADRIFQTYTIGLKVQVNSEYWNDKHLLPAMMNKYEKHIYDSLLNSR